MAEAQPATLVVDASIGLKWVIAEHGSAAAIALLQTPSLLVPPLFWTEAANALAMKVKRGELPRAAASDAWRDLLASPVTTISDSIQQHERMLALALDLEHPAYDCCYLALALTQGCPVATADARFHRAVASHAALAAHVQLLAG